MSFGVHLAADAVVAYVDRELPAIPAQRAAAHIAVCPECRAAVASQLAAKSAIGQTHMPLPSGDLLDRLRSIPMTADLGRPNTMLGVQGEELAEYVGPDPTAMQSSQLDVHASRRLRRGLLGVAAGVAVGVLAATAPTTGGVSAGTSGGSQPGVDGTSTGRPASLLPSLTNRDRGDRFMPVQVGDQSGR